ncbi:autotransporter domain-containing protein, partial [Planctomycetota bacterium]
EQGGLVQSAYGSVGALPGSAAIAQVVDTGSQWINTGSLYIGGDDWGPGGTGILVVDIGGEVQSGELVIWPDGQLEGNGRVTTPLVYNEGTIVPDGSLTIAGDLEMISGSTLQVNVDNSGNSDVLQVAGQVDLYGGTVVPVASETITQQHDFLVIQGASVAGDLTHIDRRFVNIELTDPGIPDIWFGYTADAVYLSVVALPYGDPHVVKTPNQRAVGNALQGMSDRGGNTLTQGLSKLNTLEHVRDAYDQLSGQQKVILPIVTLDIVSAFQRDLLSHLQMSPTAGTHSLLQQDRYLMTKLDADSLQRKSLWTKFYGLYGNRQNDPVGPNYHYRGGAFALGVDGQITDTWLLGLAGAAGITQISDPADTVKTDLDNLSAGLYSRLMRKPWRFDSTVSYTHLDYETERNITFTGERYDSRFDGHALSAALELGRQWQVPWDGWIEPLVGGQWTHMEIAGSRESGGIAALSQTSQPWTSVLGWLGMRAGSTLWEERLYRAEGEIRLRWVHEFGDNPPGVATTFGQDPLATFTLHDRDIARDSLLLGLGIKGQLSKHTRLHLNYDGLFNEDRASHSGSIALQYRW